VEEITNNELKESWLVFQSQGQKFWIELEKVLAVLERCPIFTVPGSRKSALGIIVFQNRVIPTFYIPEFEKEPIQKDKNLLNFNIVLVIESQRGELGIAIDQVLKITNPPLTIQNTKPFSLEPILNAGESNE